MTFQFNKSLRRPFNLDDALKPDTKLVTADGWPAEILMVAEGVHHCSAIVFKYAQMDVRGQVITWHITTATYDGQAQHGAGHNLWLYDGDISLTPSKLAIW